MIIVPGRAGKDLCDPELGVVWYSVARSRPRPTNMVCDRPLLMRPSNWMRPVTDFTPGTALILARSSGVCSMDSLSGAPSRLSR